MGHYELRGRERVWVDDQPQFYIISYNSNGGTGAPSSQSIRSGEAFTVSNIRPTRSGYTFLGWSTSNTANSPSYYAGSNYTANRSMTLYAVWLRNASSRPVTTERSSYTISYNANGGQGAPYTQTKQKNQILTLSSVKPTRSGYVFLGWSSSPAASSPTYYACGNYTANSSITLYAVWSQIKPRDYLKIVSVWAPIIAFVIGQIIQYIIFGTTGRVLLMDAIFPNIPVGPIIVSTLLGIVSIVFVIIRSLKSIDDYSTNKSYKIQCLWLYITLTALGFLIIPCVMGYLGLVISIAVFWCVEEYKTEKIPLFIAFSAFVLGQAIQWSRFIRIDEILLLTDLASTEFNVKIFAIIMTVLLFGATWMIADSIYYLSEENITCQILILLPFCAFVTVVPTLTAIPLLIYAIIILPLSLSDVDEKKKTIASKIISIVLYCVLIVALIVLGIIGASARKSVITFDFQGGYSETKSVEAIYNRDMPEATVPERTGYMFLGYFDSPVGASDDDGPICYYHSNMESASKWDKKEDTTLYARWQAKEYTVTFDKQGGSGGTSSVVAKYDAAMPSAFAPSKTGYTFKGYYTSKNGGGICFYDSNMNSSQNWNWDGNTTLYAWWDASPIYASSSPSSLADIDSTASATISVSGGTGEYYYEITNSPSGITCQMSGNKLSVTRISYGASGTIAIKVVDKTTGASTSCSISYSTIPAPSSSGSSSDGGGSECIAAGTKVLLPTHEYANVESLSVGDKIMVWDFKTSSFIESTITLFVDHGMQEYTVLTLFFEDQTSVKIIGGHVFFDISLRQYVTIDENNFQSYYGHEFLSYDDDSKYSSKKLTSAKVSVEKTSAYAIVTDTYYNCVTNSIVTATPTIPGIYQLVSSYLDDDLTFDYQRFTEDLDKYGVYSYEMFKEYITYEQYIQLCAPYFKIAEAKGFTTFDEIYELMVMYSYIY